MRHLSLFFCLAATAAAQEPLPEANENPLRRPYPFTSARVSLKPESTHRESEEVTYAAYVSGNRVAVMTYHAVGGSVTAQSRFFTDGTYVYDIPMDPAKRGTRRLHSGVFLRDACAQLDEEDQKRLRDERMRKPEGGEKAALWRQIAADVGMEIDRELSEEMIVVERDVEIHESVFEVPDNVQDVPDGEGMKKSRAWFDEQTKMHTEWEDPVIAPPDPLEFEDHLLGFEKYTWAFRELDRPGVRRLEIESERGEWSFSANIEVPDEKVEDLVGKTLVLGRERRFVSVNRAPTLLYNSHEVLMKVISLREGELAVWITPGVWEKSVPGGSGDGGQAITQIEVVGMEIRARAK